MKENENGYILYGGLSQYNSQYNSNTIQIARCIQYSFIQYSLFRFRGCDHTRHVYMNPHIQCGFDAECVAIGYCGKHVRLGLRLGLRQNHTTQCTIISHRLLATGCVHDKCVVVSVVVVVVLINQEMNQKLGEN